MLLWILWHRRFQISASSSKRPIIQRLYNFHQGDLLILNPGELCCYTLFKKPFWVDLYELWKLGKKVKLVPAKSWQFQTIPEIYAYKEKVFPTLFIIPLLQRMCQCNHPTPNCQHDSKIPALYHSLRGDVSANKTYKLCGGTSLKLLGYRDLFSSFNLVTLVSCIPQISPATQIDMPLCFQTKENDNSFFGLGLNISFYTGAIGLLCVIDPPRKL
jgi:hypothetical protein